MTDEEFDEFLSSAVDELNSKQKELTEAHGLGSYAKFWFDQEQASLDFRNEAGVTGLRAIVVPIGSWSPKGGTWKWAWSNQSVLASLREKSAALKALASTTGLAIFERDVVEADEQTAWELTAISVRHLGARGAYRAPGASSHLFLAIVELREVGAAGWK